METISNNMNVGPLQSNILINSRGGNSNIFLNQNLNFDNNVSLHSENFLEEMEREVMKHLKDASEKQHSGRSSKQMWPFLENLFSGNLLTEPKVNENIEQKEGKKKKRRQQCLDENSPLCSRKGNQQSEL